MDDAQTLDLSDVATMSRGHITTNTVLIRDCYREAEKVAWRIADTSSGSRSVIFTGQPGIGQYSLHYCSPCGADLTNPTGKTIFIWYLLVRLLQQKQVVLFHFESICLLFYFDGVYKLRDAGANLPKPQRGAFIWSLVDVDRGNPVPPLACSIHCFPVIAPSPKLSPYKRLVDTRAPLVTAFPPWSMEELRQGCDTLQRPVYLHALTLCSLD